ncbi:hypothetical protein CR513_39173, partial [Mucuna pruriens]
MDDNVVSNLNLVMRRRLQRTFKLLLSNCTRSSHFIPLHTRIFLKRKLYTL